ncbi:predicted protein [Chaetomium globosum CBS 148.51]|uniref:Uncharacterized protein n=1 Tax=Chaetomium globosum (strain ATCC 6205 / CBS 148.51 / DSM 1962 / NBRC 6347 / NRRL 1970) TaxID=306901 RepID=Q2H596_CHAGB|nr:uncharacterized protein CHGG_06169 [Chaetomium globosum CBS 148.51]EAQ89550.1 predicted protein [Chaetomium globosum CBS 148.51]
MTSRNLNQTWRDVVLKQYEADHAADVPFPVRYLIHAPEWQRDISISIPTKIDVAPFRQAVLAFCKARRLADDPAYDGDLLSVRARVSPRPDPSASAPRNDDDAPSPQDDIDQPEPGVAGISG